MRLLSPTSVHAWGLILPVVPLCVIGVLCIQVTDDAAGGGVLAPAAAKQVVYILLGLVGLGVAVSIGYLRLGWYAYPLFVLGLILLVWLVADRWVNLPLVEEQRNARRWIDLGPAQLQPSELMKIGYVLALAWYLRYRRNYRTLRGLVPPFALTLLPMALIKMQPDLGTVLLFLPVLFAMIYAAGAKVKHLAVIVLLGALAVPVFWFKIAGYQRLRIAGVCLQSPVIREFLQEHPRVWTGLSAAGGDKEEWQRELDDWEANTGYQLVRSKTAVATGGLTGQGWGRGIFVEFDFLPEKHNDFIFAIVAHQWGSLGCLLLVVCYTALVFVGFDVATLTNDPFGRLAAVGLSSMLAVQTLTNLCMTVGLGPITGVTLPFVSAGGSSLVASFLTVGLLISVAHRRPMLIANPPFEFNEERERFSLAAR